MRLIRPALALALLAPAWVTAQRQVAQQGDPGNALGTRLLRTPAVSATQIAFAYANNIWVADRSGGVARRLTSFQGQTQNPKFSPDGRVIAFTAEYGGNSDVYVVPSSGGEPKRLTWHPGNDVVQGWTPDGARVVFASTRASDGPSAIPRFWTVPVAGGVEEAMVVPRAYQGKISPDGRRLAYRMNNSWDEERRNYRGGQNRAVWILDLKSYDLETVPWTDTKDMDPVWVDDNTVYFLSDRDGVSNVWSYDRRTKQVSQVTRFTDFDVKALDAGGGAVVFEQAGYVHELDPKTGREHIVPITAAGDFPWMMPEWKDVANRMTNVALSPSGKRAAVEARGEIFTIPAEKGDVRNLSHSSGSAEIDPAWSPDGKFVSYFSDRSGEYKLYIEAQDGLTPPREITIPNHKHYYTSSWSPDGKRILFHDTDQQVWVVDVASGQAKVIGNDPWAVPQRTLNPVWSPDGKWVAYAKRLNSLYRAIVVYNVETGESKQVTDGLADAMYPAWDASGKYLWFLASTDFGLGSQWLDMSRNDHDETFSLYAIVLKKTEPTPWAPESDEEGVIVAGAPRDSANGGGAPAGAATRGARGAQAPSAGENARPAQRPTMPTVSIDFDGIAQRTLAVPGIPNRMYSRLHAGASGTVFYLEQQPSVGGGGGGFGGGGQVLHRYTLRDRKNVQFAANVADYDVSLDGKKLLYRSAGGGGGFGGGAAGRQAPSLFIVDADKGPPQAGSGRLNVQLRAYIDPKLEFAQIFNEGWRNQRDYLYVPNEHGSDWAKMKQMYGQLLPYVNHRADLNYLLDNMGAEIAVGHSFVRGGDMPDVPDATGGLLGADFAIENGRYRITKIYDTESWNPDLRAPLAGPGIDVKVGEYIIAINGEELRAPDNIYRLLDGTANRQTTIAVNARPTLEGARNVVVVPVANEQGLRSRAWIEKNRRIVDSLSNGQLAYVYLPNTAGGGYSYFNRYYFAQQDRKGAILDERFNSGGQAADYIIDVLGRKFDGYFNNVAGDRTPFTSPEAGIWGPKVMIINEMAGSGGDLMPYMFQYRKIGPLVGKRTWGGLVHTADTPGFIDGGSMIAPRGGFISREGQWRVENEGTAPDIDVENTPREVIAGHDPQLERAVAEAMRMLREHPVERMTKEPPPPTWGKRAVPVVP